MGYANAGGKLFYFDSNDGLSEFDGAGAFTQFVTSNLSTTYKPDVDDWVDNHDSYKITV